MWIMNEKMMELRHTFISSILITASLISNMTSARNKILVFVTRVCNSVLVKYMDPNQTCLQVHSTLSCLISIFLRYHVEYFIFYTRMKKKDEENHSISQRLRKKTNSLFYLSRSSFETNPGLKVVRSKHGLSPETL